MEADEKEKSIERQTTPKLGAYRIDPEKQRPLVRPIVHRSRPVEGGLLGQNGCIVLVGKLPVTQKKEQ